MRFGQYLDMQWAKVIAHSVTDRGMPVSWCNTIVHEDSYAVGIMQGASFIVL